MSNPSSRRTSHDSGALRAGSIDGSNPSPSASLTGKPNLPSGSIATSQSTPDAQNDFSGPPRSAVLLLRHQSLKEKLIESLDSATERLAVLVEQAKVEMESQDEHIKRSAINRKLIANLKVQVREERKRRDRLLQQQRTQKHSMIQTMQAQVERQASEIDRLESDLQHKGTMLKLRQAKLAALKEDIADANIKAESVWRSGNRVLQAPKTSSEVLSQLPETSREMWLDSLKGIKATERKKPIAADVMRRKRAADFLKVSKVRGDFYAEEYRDMEADADAQFAIIKEVGTIAENAARFVENQKRAIQELRRRQGLDIPIPEEPEKKRSFLESSTEGSPASSERLSPRSDFDKRSNSPQLEVQSHSRSVGQSSANSEAASSPPNSPKPAKLKQLPSFKKSGVMDDGDPHANSVSFAQGYELDL